MYWCHFLVLNGDCIVLTRISFLAGLHTTRKTTWDCLLLFLPWYEPFHPGKHRKSTLFVNSSNFLTFQSLFFQPSITRSPYSHPLKALDVVVLTKPFLCCMVHESSRTSLSSCQFWGVSMGQHLSAYPGYFTVEIWYTFYTASTFVTFRDIFVTFLPFGGCLHEKLLDDCDANTTNNDDDDRRMTLVVWFCDLRLQCMIIRILTATAVLRWRPSMTNKTSNFF